MSAHDRILITLAIVGAIIIVLVIVGAGGILMWQRLAAQLAAANARIAELEQTVAANAVQCDRDAERFAAAIIEAWDDQEPEPEPVPSPWDRFATPLDRQPLALPPAPDVMAAIAPPAWAGSTSIFNDLAASSTLHTVARAAAPPDTRLTNFTGDMAAYVRSITDPVDAVDDHEDGCSCVECQYEAIAQADVEQVRQLAEVGA